MNMVFHPFCDRATFAERTGITKDVLEKWIRDGRIKTFRIGKRSLIDLRQWIDSEDLTRLASSAAVAERITGGASAASNALRSRKRRTLKAKAPLGNPALNPDSFFHNMKNE